MVFEDVDNRKRHICALIPSSVLKKIFYEILESAGVGCREKGRGVNLHTIPHSSLNTKQTKDNIKKMLNLAIFLL